MLIKRGGFSRCLCTHSFFCSFVAVCTLLRSGCVTMVVVPTVRFEWSQSRSAVVTDFPLSLLRTLSCIDLHACISVKLRARVVTSRLNAFRHGDCHVVTRWLERPTFRTFLLPQRQSKTHVPFRALIHTWDHPFHNGSDTCEGCREFDYICILFAVLPLTTPDSLL